MPAIRPIASITALLLTVALPGRPADTAAAEHEEHAAQPAAATAASPATAPSTPATSVAVAPPTDPAAARAKAQELIKKTIAVMSSAKTMQAEFESSLNVSGRNVQRNGSILYIAPDRLRVDLEEGPGKRTVIAHGKEILLLENNTYSRRRVRHDEMLYRGTGGLESLVLLFQGRAPITHLAEPSYLGTGEDGVATLRLDPADKTGNFQGATINLREKDGAFLERFIVTAGGSPQDGPQFERLINVRLDEKIDEAKLELTIPEGYKEREEPTSPDNDSMSKRVGQPGASADIVSSKSVDETPPVPMKSLMDRPALVYMCGIDAAVNSSELAALAEASSQGRMKGFKTLVVLEVPTDIQATPDQMLTFFPGLDYYYDFGSKLKKEYAINTLPALVATDKDGVIKHAQAGDVDPLDMERAAAAIGVKIDLFNPRQDDLWLNAYYDGLTQALVGKYDDARDLLRTNFNKPIQHMVPAIMDYSILSVKTGKKDEAVEALKQGAESLRRYPASMAFPAVNTFAYFMVENDLDLPGAEKLARSIFENDVRRNPGVADTLAWALFKQGKTDEAVKLLDEAAHRSDDPLIWFHFGRALETANKKDEALQAYMRSVAARGPDEAKERMEALMPK